ncbi:MAG: GIY-YIG nuclease family protein [Candidatus Paceibacterota bacterium]|jgi:excinuclease UvrABC nuclease subunit
MKLQDLTKLKFPDAPGVYFFVGPNKKILYIGKATSLKDRVRSYFTKDVVATRGLHIENMVNEAGAVRVEVTDSVLEALVLESHLIKKHQPKYNTREKDDKSFNYVVVTKEDFPRVLVVRGRDLEAGVRKGKEIVVKYSFGPFPKGGELREAMKLVRKIFPFRDKCTPLIQRIQSETLDRNRVCFNRQIGLCPGVCSGEISKEDYAKQIRNLKLFFEGKTKTVIKNLEREMKTAAKSHNFERAGEVKRMLFALTHIQDVALMKREMTRGQVGNVFRIEAYDIAHLSGKNMVGVMVVIEDGYAKKSDYRKFKIRSIFSSDDTGALSEMVRRRLGHFEWPLPQVVVVDGNNVQKRVAEKILSERGFSIDVVAVVKDEQHRPREIIGRRGLIEKWEREILLANSEAHRFAIKYHRELRDKIR